MKIIKDGRSMIFTGTMPTTEEAEAGKVFLKSIYEMCGKQAGTIAITKIQIGKKWVGFKIEVGTAIKT